MIIIIACNRFDIIKYIKSRIRLGILHCEARRIPLTGLRAVVVFDKRSSAQIQWHGSLFLVLVVEVLVKYYGNITPRIIFIKDFPFPCHYHCYFFFPFYRPGGSTRFVGFSTLPVKYYNNNLPQPRLARGRRGIARDGFACHAAVENPITRSFPRFIFFVKLYLLYIAFDWCVLWRNVGERLLVVCGRPSRVSVNNNISLSFS